MAELLVRIRLSGPAEAVAIVAERLRRELEVAKASRDYANRRDDGVRRYLAVLVPELGSRGGEE